MARPAIGKSLNKDITFDSREEFFRRHVEIANLFVPEADKLSRLELIFLAKWCEYLYEGKDINSHQDLTTYMVKERVVSTTNGASTYKTKLRQKRWLKKIAKNYVLPQFLIFGVGEQLKTRINLTHGLTSEN